MCGGNYWCAFYSNRVSSIILLENLENILKTQWCLVEWQNVTEIRFPGMWTGWQIVSFIYSLYISFSDFIRKLDGWGLT